MFQHRNQKLAVMPVAPKNKTVIMHRVPRVLSQSPDQISWMGNLVCSIGFNADGERLEPERGTVLYHTFVVHKELFNGLGVT